MKQEHVLTELAVYCNPNPTPADTTHIAAALAYRKACVLMFECGTLSYEAVRSADFQPLKNIQAGYDYFVKWFDGLLAAQPDFSPVYPKQTMFFAWQTWDLLCLFRFGFAVFCENFVQRPPGNFCVPVRVSGRWLKPYLVS